MFLDVVFLINDLLCDYSRKVHTVMLLGYNVSLCAHVSACSLIYIGYSAWVSAERVYVSVIGE